MSSEYKSSIYLIPIPIAEGALQTLSAEVVAHTRELRHYFAENVRTARRFLRSLHADLVLEDVHFSEIDKHTGADRDLFRSWMKAGYKIGIMSEAGCPGIADPGADLVSMAQSSGATIVPLTGPNSIILALMASGLNGQSFCFNGYLPVKDPQRSRRIKELEEISTKDRQTQIFIETPYRNNQMLADLLRHCQPRTKICIALNITGTNASIRTKMAADWKKGVPVMDKEPAVFLMLG